MTHSCMAATASSGRKSAARALQRAPMSEPKCPKHQRVLVCLSCLGAKGGKKKSPKKAASSKANFKTASDVRWGKKPGTTKT